MTPILLAAATTAVEAAPAVSGITGNLTFGLTGAAAALGIGLIGARAAEAVGRNPGAFGKVLTISIIAMALAEAMGIFGLVFLLMGK